MCTVVLRLEPGRVDALLVRDELLDRPTAPTASWWPDLPGVVGARDLEAGGTAAALDLDGARFAAVLNGCGLTPDGPLLTRGTLPLDALRGRFRSERDLLRSAPYHLLVVDETRAWLESWDGEERRRRELSPGDHVVVNEGADVVGEARHDAVAAAWSETLPRGEDPAGWASVVRAAVVQPVEVDGRRYGTRSLTRVRISEGHLTAAEAESLEPATSWAPVTGTGVMIAATKGQP